MPAILEVTAEDIFRLDESQLHCLLEQLLLAEKRCIRRPDATVVVSHEVRAPDRGIDGEWSMELFANNAFPDPVVDEIKLFIPAPNVIYQCKATEMGPQNCANEMMNSEGAVKAAIFERLNRPVGEAAYVFVCTQKVGNRDAIVKREKKASAQLSAGGIKDPIVRFLDAETLAQWANRHIATRKFAIRQGGRESADHLLLLAEWARTPDVNDYPFCTNTEIERIISEIRNELLNRGKIIRVTGNSGLGKTRIVYEVFNADIDGLDVENSIAKALGKAVVYIDVESSTVGDDTFKAIREGCLRGDRGVVIIDNCSIERHEEFSKWFLDKECKMKLITIDYLGEDASSRGKLISLKPKMFHSIVPEILKRSPIARDLTESAVDAISNFAQGYSRVAVLAAELGRAPTAADRNHKEYVERLLWGRSPPDGKDRHKKFIQALASVAVLGTGGRVADQYPFLLRTLLRSDSPDEWRSELYYFRRRRILEPLGDYMIVSPAPIAVALFSEWLEQTPVEDIHAFAGALSDVGLLEPFCKQLRRLGLNPSAGEIAQRFCEGPFVFAENLISGSGSQILRSLAELNPTVVSNVLYNALGNKSGEEILMIDGEARRNLVTTFARLAADESTFEQAFWLLILFSSSENETWGNNATGCLEQLFHAYLSGTVVSGFDRLYAAKKLIHHDREAIRHVVIKTVAAGLDSGPFSRMATPSFSGQLDASLDWRPANNAEALRYYKECFLILEEIILKGGADEEIAKELLSEKISVVLQSPLIIDLDKNFNKLSIRFGHVWPTVKSRIKQILEIHNEDLKESHRIALERWKSYLTPPSENITERIRDTVSLPGWHNRLGEDNSYVDISQDEAEQFAKEIVDRNIDLTLYLEQILSGEQQQAFSFGVIIGRSHQSLKNIFDCALQLWPNLDHKVRTSSLLRGMMWGLGQGSQLRTEILDRVFNQSDLIDLLVPLTVSVDKISEVDFLRIRKAMEESRLDTANIRGLIQGHPLRSLPDEFVLAQFRHIFRDKPMAAPELFSVLWMHCHRDQNRFLFFTPLFKNLLLAKGMPTSDGHFAWEWQEVAKSIIAASDDSVWFEKVAEYIRNSLIENQTWIGTEFLSKIVSQLFKKAPKETWRVFDQTLRDGTYLQKYIIVEFLARSGGMFDDSGSPLWELPPEQFREWVRINLERIPLLLDKVSLYKVESQNGVERFVWHPCALILLQEGTNEEELEGSLSANLFSFGSTGSRIPYLEKRLALAKDLEASNEPKLKRIAEKLIGRIAERIEFTKREEENENARYL